MSLPIIFINGFPGVGKLTIARKLVDLLARYKGKLVQNHIGIDPAGALLPRHSPHYRPLVRAIRPVVSDTLASRDTFDSTFVFTGFQSDDEIGSASMAEFRSLARLRGCTFVLVTVTCSREENVHRLTTPERFRRGKLTDVRTLEHIRDNKRLYQPSGYPFHMELDVTELSARAAARLIFEHLPSVCPELSR